MMSPLAQTIMILKKGFIAAIIMPLDQGLLCATTDQHFFSINLLGRDVEVNAE